MLEADEAFRDGEYADAARAYRRADLLGNDSPESLLGLMHAQFAEAGGYFTLPGATLSQLLQRYGDLPLAPLKPRRLYGEARGKDYDRHLADLREFLLVRGQDPAAGLLAAYFDWFDGQGEKASIRLDEALAARERIVPAPSRSLDPWIVAIEKFQTGIAKANDRRSKSSKTETETSGSAKPDAARPPTGGP